MTFLRRSMRDQGFLAAADLEGPRNYQKIKLAGLVLIRQRPGSAKGVCFITLEDETGTANLVVWPKVMEEFRKVVMQARLLVMEGHIQREGEIVHLVAERLTDRTDALLRLAPGGFAPALSRADEMVKPVQGSARGSSQAHPRVLSDESDQSQLGQMYSLSAATERSPLGESGVASLPVRHLGGTVGGTG
jgi:error-prone DNA polymerase